MSCQILQGDVSVVLPELAEASFDACVCDPPYGLSFMGKAWDHGVPSSAVWAEVSRPLKPGASLFAFGGTRTWHRLACALEDAGFEIRDTLMWIYGQGFPKSKNLSGHFEGYGTALKPAWEPILWAMKPCDGTYAENALKHGVAGINVDGGRIETFGDTARPQGKDIRGGNWSGNGGRSNLVTGGGTGRWPANLLLDEESAAALDEMSGDRASGYRSNPSKPDATDSVTYGMSGLRGERGYKDSGGASRFFYTTKASRSERESGLLGRIPCVKCGQLSSTAHKNDKGEYVKCVRNDHPTVKPLDISTYLAKLLLPPDQSTPRRILVPFSGSGSEIIACRRAGWDEIVAIEIDSHYCEIASARLGTPTITTEP